MDLLKDIKLILLPRGTHKKKNKTLSPVVRSVSVCTVIALTSMNSLTVHQMNITTAFLHGGLKEEIYMKHPKGFVPEGQECQFKKSIYGLKQASHCGKTLATLAQSKMG